MNYISYQLMLARHDELLREAASRRLAKQATEQATGRPAERKRASASACRHRVPLLVREKEPIRLSDEIAQRRRDLPLQEVAAEATTIS
jgi:Bacterial protein of unknown function (DUF899)